MDDALMTLSRHPYFAGLPASLLTAIRARVITRHYKKGALIYSEGEPSQGLYLTASGMVVSRLMWKIERRSSGAIGRTFGSTIAWHCNTAQ